MHMLKKDDVIADLCAFKVVTAAFIHLHSATLNCFSNDGRVQRCINFDDKQAFKCVAVKKWQQQFV
jgi:hypothetical protein